MIPNRNPDLFASVNIYKREDPENLIFLVNVTNHKEKMTYSFLVSSAEEVSEKILQRLRLMNQND